MVYLGTLGMVRLRTKGMALSGTLGTVQGMVQLLLVVQIQ